MILPANPTADEIQAALGLIRTKLKAGLIHHPSWPPPDRMPDENKLLLLDRIANEVLNKLRSGII